MTRRAVFALSAALALPVLVAADAPPDFVGKCQQAVAKKAGVDTASVKVRGKYKGQDGRTNLDFKLADGRVGVCRSKPDATVDEIKMEEPKP